MVETMTRNKGVMHQAGKDTGLSNSTDSIIHFRGVRVFPDSDYRSNATYDAITKELYFYGAPRPASPEFTKSFMELAKENPKAVS